ncbi:hypothetical protein [Polaribacter sp. HL-MS24]|uniref:hypothetical protein n=1 Tax=Polaribacter sp. HL-MS24 TaxID=3077735 RepID=UPI0029346841|nr:hypothetical protein [Polaribacter sp. HL-MS24]WOC40473.1 hypothetical protein RRF69_01345 [Polaribacter sp. HL-MS24]
MTKKQVYLRISICFALLGLLLSIFYRPYIYANNVSDFGFADVIGSFVSVISFCTFVWCNKEYSNKVKNSHIFLAIFVYGVLWEFLGYLKLYGTFDKKDIFATIVSGLLTYFIKMVVEKKYDKKYLKKH